MKKTDIGELAGGRTLELKLTIPLPADEPTHVLTDVVAALRKRFPTHRFSIEFAPKGMAGRRYVNIVVPTKPDPG